MRSFFREDLLVSSWVAPLGIAALSSGMVIGRALGDWFRSQYQDALLIASCAAIATLHLVIFVSTGTPVVALVTIFMSGLGLSVLVPIAYAAAGPGAGDAGLRTENVMAQLTSFAYGALLLGPAVIGGLSDSFGLRGTLWLLPVLMATAVIASALSLKKHSLQVISEK